MNSFVVMKERAHAHAHTHVHIHIHTQVRIFGELECIAGAAKKAITLAHS